MMSTISVSARLYDQYGAGIRVDENGNAYQITLTIDEERHDTSIRQTPIRTLTVSRLGMGILSRSRASVPAAAAAAWPEHCSLSTTSRQPRTTLDVAWAVFDATIDDDGEHRRRVC